MIASMSRETNEILEKIGNLQGTMDEGFKGVHRRQDVANGRMAKVEDRVDRLEKEGVRIEGAIAHNTEYTESFNQAKNKWIDRGLNFILYIIGLLAFTILVKTGILNL